MDYFNAFWVGGLICALVQILMEKTKMMPGRTQHRGYAHVGPEVAGTVADMDSGRRGFRRALLL